MLLIGRCGRCYEGRAQVDNRYRVVRDKLNFATDGCKADRVDYCIVTRVILMDVHVKSIAVMQIISVKMNGARYFIREM